jgi:hypothetical protein
VSAAGAQKLTIFDHIAGDSTIFEIRSQWPACGRPQFDYFEFSKIMVRI